MEDGNTDGGGDTHEENSIPAKAGMPGDGGKLISNHSQLSAIHSQTVSETRQGSGDSRLRTACPSRADRRRGRGNRRTQRKPSE